MPDLTALRATAASMRSLVANVGESAGAVIGPARLAGWADQVEKAAAVVEAIEKVTAPGYPSQLAQRVLAAALEALRGD